jgi:hypothetical protein
MKLYIIGTNLATQNQFSNNNIGIMKLGIIIVELTISKTKLATK